MEILRDSGKYHFLAASARYSLATIETLRHPIADGVRDLEIEGLKKPYDYVAAGPSIETVKPPAFRSSIMRYSTSSRVSTFFDEIGNARSWDEGKTRIDRGASRWCRRTEVRWKSSNMGSVVFSAVALANLWPTAPVLPVISSCSRIWVVGQ
jgi:hypothetical protein